MSISYPSKERYSVSDLLEIVSLLRSPEGCPWDREQTHESIRSNMLEEACEAIEAINQHDPEHLKEELGDVLFQVVFHSQMASESGTFTLEDVADGICKKMLARHPHVFGDAAAEDAGQALAAWDAVKRQTSSNQTQADLLQSVPRSLPSLMRAEKVQRRASRVGFDHADVSEALADFKAAVSAVEKAVESNDTVATAMGRMLFAAVALGRQMGWEAEQSLTDETDAFITQFREWEQHQ